MTDFKFTEKHIKKIEKTLGIQAIKRSNHYRFEFKNVQKNLGLNIELYPDTPIGNRSGNLITIYTNYGIQQLHFCTGFIASELLGEITFIGEQIDHFNAFVIEKEGGFSFYSNIDKSLVRADFTQLEPEVMMTGVALSIIEPILDGGELPDDIDE
ncbi:MAG: hypothetical protein KDD94_07905 [Calditrichaeota bacterium]|nr:hypothetical protein [Calditrichota bacterium]